MFQQFITKLIDQFFPQTCVFCKIGNEICCDKCFLEIPQNIKFGPSLANVLSENLRSKFSLKTDTKIFLIPIPLNQNDKRLHNHANLLAESIKSNLSKDNIIILDNILIKNSAEKQSHTKSRTERFENIKEAFSVNPHLQGPHPNPPPSGEGEVQNIYIIVDDVTTTGATINEARKVLSQYLQISESEILAITIAN